MDGDGEKVVATPHLSLMMSVGKLRRVILHKPQKLRATMQINPCP